MKGVNINTDVLVIGGAGAGLRSAIEARRNGVDVVLASKMPAAGNSCTMQIAGWITCSTKANEDELFKQVVYTGGYLNDQNLVEVLVKDAVFRIPELREFGVPLEERAGETPEMPGHYMIPRIENHPKGYALVKSMRDKAESMGVTILDDTPISTLLTDDASVAGAVGLDLKALQPVIISAKAIVIATGGGAYAFERSDNPPGSTGDGIVLAYNAGAEIVDIEFISLNVPRNIIPEIFGITSEPPEHLINKGTAHYFLGGIKIDDVCRTNVKGLFAAGEVTGGILGALRQGGSAVADIIVFGARAGNSAGQWAKKISANELNNEQIDSEIRKFERMTENDGFPAPEVLAELKSILWRYMGPVKSEYTLNKALEKLSQTADKVSALRATNADEFMSAIEASNIMELGRIIATASLMRKETRGNFWRADYPKPNNDNWIKHIVLYKDDDDIKSRLDDVVMTRLHSPGEPPIGSGCFWYFPKMDIS